MSTIYHQDTNFKSAAEIGFNYGFSILKDNELINLDEAYGKVHVYIKQRRTNGDDEVTKLEAGPCNGTFEAAPFKYYSKYRRCIDSN